MTTLTTSRCVFNAGTALQRVFISPIERSNTSSLRSSHTQKLPRPPQRRSYYFTPAVKPAKTEEFRFPRDNEIKSSSIFLVSDDGRLDDRGPISRAKILSSLDLKTHSLRVVQEGEPGKPPICKIINKKEYRDAERAKVKKAKAGQITTKTIELNWAIDGNDLRHRLGRIADFLGKGLRVEVLLAPKRKGRKATEEEAEELVQKIRGVLDGIEGAKETKAMEGKMLKTATLFLAGKKGKGKDNDELNDAEAEQEDGVHERVQLATKRLGDSEAVEELVKRPVANFLAQG